MDPGVQSTDPISYADCLLKRNLSVHPQASNAPQSLTRPRCSGLAKLTKRDALGLILLFLASLIMVIAGFQLMADWVVQFWLAEAITQYLQLPATLSNEVLRFVFSLSTILTIAGVAIILGTVVWSASPPRPHWGTDLTIVTGKTVISFGVSIATLPLATMLFGIWAAFVLSIAGFQIAWLVFLLPSLGLQLAGLILTGVGSMLFASYRHGSR